MKKIIIFGAGQAGKRAKRFLGREHEVLYFTDNNAALHSTVIDNVVVVPPQKLSEMSFDEVYIASMYKEAIYTQLVERVGLDKDKIFFVEQDVIEGRYEFQKGCFLFAFVFFIVLTSFSFYLLYHFNNL